MLKEKDTSNLDDLMTRVRELRCEESFHTIFNIFYPKVTSYLKLNGVESEKASEIAQEVLLVVWNKASAFEVAKGSLSGWVFTIARNLRFDHFRSNKHEALSVTAEDIFESLQDDSPHPDLDALSNEVRVHIESLPQDQKDVIQAMYIDGYSHSEYSEIKNIPIGTVKSRIRLAFAHLKKALEEK